MFLFWIYRSSLAALYLILRLGSLFYRSPSFRERLGFYSAEKKKGLAVGYNLWLHAASAGEVNAITPFCRAFKKAKPGARIVLTTTSETGKKIAIEKEVADEVFLAPLDMAPCLKRAFTAIRPVMILVAETEFWPNWFLRAGRNGVPLLLVNGRISDKSFPSYRRLKGFFTPALNCFNTCLVQTQLDAERLESLGVSPKRIQVMGQMKYDLQAPDGQAVQIFKETLRLSEKDILFTLGSLRGGEDDELLPHLKEILALSPDLKVLIAPRHLKNVEPYRQKLKDLGVGNVLRSGMEKDTRLEQVIVLDTVGELSLAYALSRAAFVGGTLTPIGGHNVMEPALSRVPVCFGPHTQNIGEAAKALLESGGGLLVNDGPGLVEAFRKWMDAGAARDAGNRAFLSAASMRGATERTVQQVAARWPIDQPL